MLMGIILATGPCAQAAAKITGGSRFKFGAKNATVTFGCDGILNASKENATGSLILSLWAFNGPYGGTRPVKGTELATYKLKGMNPSSTYGRISATSATKLPARGSYVICLILSEFRGGKYVVVDHRNFDGAVSLAPLPLFTMSGPWSWLTSNEGGTVEIQVGQISHTRNSHTGTLKLTVWATRAPWNSSASGYTLGVVQKEALKQGFSYTNFKNTAKYTRPPPGVYYITLLLSEFSDGEYRFRTALTSSKPSTFQ